MWKKIGCLALALILVFAFTASALAENVLEYQYITYSEQGILIVEAKTDYTNSADLNFKLSTENGELNIIDGYVLRDLGTSWFFIVDYDKNAHNDTMLNAELRIMNNLATIVDDMDNGAVILAGVDQNYHLEQSSGLRDSLRTVPATTDGSKLADTLSQVYNFIGSASTNPNVVVVIISPAHPNTMNSGTISAIERTIKQHATVTTHVMAVSPSSGNNTKGWFDQARDLGKLAEETRGGKGFVTSSLANEGVDKATDDLRKWERSRVQLYADPVKKETIGKQLTITQTTSGGMELKDTITLTDEFVNGWSEAYNPGPDPTKEPEPRKGITYSGANSMLVNYNNGSRTQSSSFPVAEVAVGGGAALIIAALVVVLILSKKKGSSKKVTGAAVYAAGAAAAKPAASGGPTLTLIGQNGATLKGQMKNNKLTFGRDAGRGAMLAVPGDGKLSGLHATFSRNGNTMTLTDNHSTNGTKVNGQAVTGTVTLQQNDTVTMGSTTYTVTWR